MAFLAITMGDVYRACGEISNSFLVRYPLRWSSMIGMIACGTSRHLARCEGGISWLKSSSKAGMSNIPRPSKGSPKVCKAL